MYKKKCLFKNSNGSFSKDASAIESVWAYVHGVDTKKTGRFRIRITKMGAQELIQMGIAPEETPDAFYGIQAYLEKWQDLHGWLPLFDWVGDPMSEIDSIESHLCRQFEAFITGISMEEYDSFDFPPKSTPNPPKSKKPPFKLPVPEITTKDEEVTTTTDDDSDIDWL